MTAQQTADELRAFIAAEFLDGEDASELTDDYDIAASGVIDSLGLVRLVSHIATTYQVPMDGIDIKPENFRTIAAITELIGRHSGSVVA
ncbi:phosphopantetheine-binding protein [Streptomyces sp. S.PB5]|uniref:acyl carrier protein n=1 Tax=Streptomyces sp. S.PB5 TaxID=3020844 RepID=UPI0025AF8391|nr:phosphopantetheine-binding protein [Streptomyces sp. S.PB5]MDN3026457.1 phosphopantetheine-binding protein [Streptomyces sp. S.PB5]